MRNLLLLSFIFFLAFKLGFAQSQDQNYIQTFDLRIAGYTSGTSDFSVLPASQVSENITYMDGLGRPMQSIARRANRDQKDVAAFKTFDAFGRDINNYLPYSLNQSNGKYDPNYLQSVSTYYQSEPGIAHDNYPLSPVKYENSPAGRILNTGYPGADGQTGSSYRVSYAYTYNNPGEAVYNAVQWDYSLSTNTCTRGAAYNAGELTVNEVTDEDGARNLQFTDKTGKLILKRGIKDDGTLLNTYYVYDDLTNLRYIITPEAETRLTGTFSPDNTIIKDYAYYYCYDSKGRLTMRQSPGRAQECFIYDKLNRLLLYQDGNLRTTGKWLFKKYDALGRNIITGTAACGAGLTLSELQDLADNLMYVNEFISSDNFGTKLGYTNNVMPVLQNTGEIQTINYFDTYHYLEQTGSTVYYRYLHADANLIFADPAYSTYEYLADTVHVTGKLTCTRTRLVENGIATWLVSAYYYDKYGRMIQSRAQNQRSGYDITSLHYAGLTSNIDYTKHEQKNTRLGTHNYNHTEENTNTYDHAGRLLQNRYRINYSSIERILDLSYNTLGQLIQKNISNSSNLLQSVDYKYSIRGSLLAINDAALSDGENDLFGMELYYNLAEGQLPNTPRHNGTLSAIKWQSNNTGIKAYTYAYDKPGNLLSGTYAEKTGSAWSFNDKYSEKNISFDLNGNIKTLTRNGLKSPNNTPGAIDDLSYYYKGNQLIGVNDAVTNNNIGDFYDNGFSAIPDPANPATWEYKYDDNGNLISDKSKGIVNITYNYLTQPVSIDMGSGKRITYVYDGSGRRLQKTDYLNGAPVTTSDYIANFVYNNNVVAYAQNAEGRIVFTNLNTVYSESYITDHLGNVRATFRCNAQGQPYLLQTNDFYPYGQRIKALASENSFPNEYLYQGKELDNENGLNWYDFHARLYDPVLGRWHTPDPAQQYVSPYMAMGNDPANRVDPNGQIDIGHWFTGAWNSLKQFWKDKIVSSNGGADKEGNLYNSKSWNVDENAYGVFIVSGTTIVSAAGSGGGGIISSGNTTTASTGASGVSKQAYVTSQFSSDNLVFNTINKGATYLTKGAEKFSKIALLVSKGIVPDLATVSYDQGITIVKGVSYTLQGNLFLTGQNPGPTITTTVNDNRTGGEADYGVNYGVGWYLGDDSDITRNSILGQSFEISGGYLWGGSIWWAHNEKTGKLSWVGVKIGYGAILGFSYGNANTTTGFTGFLNHP